MMLSRAENDVLMYLRQGKSNQQIADMLFVCEKTVKFHLTNIYKKLNVSSRAELIAQEGGLVTYDKGVKQMELHSGKQNTLSPSVQKTNAVVVPDKKTAEQKIQFIDETFKVGETITQLHTMMTEVTKDGINPSSVNAACNCVARLNETINTAIAAARFLNG